MTVRSTTDTDDAASVSPSSSGVGTNKLDRGIVVLIAAMATAAFMAVLNGTAVSVALDSFQQTFDAPVSLVVWVMVGYLISAGMALPLMGWASDRFGTRQVFLAGLAIFVGGSILSGLAWSAPTLIIFRVIQGFGGGLLEPASLALVAAVAPKSQVGKIMGFFSLIINIAPVLGPLFGGLLVGSGLWRGIFLINIPLGIAVLISALRLIPRPAANTTGGSGVKADIRGMVLLSPGVVGLLFGFNQWGAGADLWIVILSLGLGLVLTGLYVAHALTTRAVPLLDLRLLKTPGFAGSLSVMALVGLIMYSQLVSLPLYAESVHGLSGAWRGLLVCALGVGLIVSMSNASRISDQTGPRPLVRFGAIATALGMATFALFNGSWPLPAVLALFVFIGLAFGCVASPAFSSVYRILPAESIAQGTTSLFITVQLTASLGVTLIGFLMSRVAEGQFTWVFGILTVAALVAALMSRLLPGRPVA